MNRYAGPDALDLLSYRVGGSYLLETLAWTLISSTDASGVKTGRHFLYMQLHVQLWRTCGHWESSDQINLWLFGVASSDYDSCIRERRGSTYLRVCCWSAARIGLQRHMKTEGSRISIRGGEFTSQLDGSIALPRSATAQ